MATTATRTISRILAPFALIIAIGACGDDDPTDPEPVAEIDVTTAAATITSIGGTSQLSAVASDGDGETLPGVTFEWSSSDTDVATVSTSGLVTAQGEGTAEITAEADGVTGSTTITVDVPVDEIELTAEAETLEVGETMTLTISVLGPDGNELPESEVTWTSSDEGVATVSVTGVVTGEAPGEVTITAASEGVSGTIVLTITPPPASVEVEPATTQLVSIGATADLTATVLDIDGGPIVGALVEWSSSDEAVATVNETGTVTAEGEGDATITASVGDVSGTATVSVDLEVAAVVVTPDPAQVQVGSTVQLEAEAQDAGGSEVGDATFTWTSDADAVATVDANGLVTGVTEGTATITATSEGIEGTAAVTVVAAPTLAIVSGAGQEGRTEEDYVDPLVVEVTDALGDPVEGIAIDWVVVSGDATLSAASSTTDAQGQASVIVTGGTSTGEIEVQAASVAAVGGPISFTLETTVAVVSIIDQAFVDLQGRTNAEFEVDVRVGDTIEWQYVEDGTMTHTVTSTVEPTGGASFDSGILNPGETFQFTPQVEGTWTFLCEIHPGVMVDATINVVAGT